MVKSIAATAFSVNKFCLDSGSKINVIHQPLRWRIGDYSLTSLIVSAFSYFKIMLTKIPCMLEFLRYYQIF